MTNENINKGTEARRITLDIIPRGFLNVLDEIILGIPHFKIEKEAGYAHANRMVFLEEFANSIERDFRENQQPYDLLLTPRCTEITGLWPSGLGSFMRDIKEDLEKMIKPYNIRCLNGYGEDRK